VSTTTDDIPAAGANQIPAFNALTFDIEEWFHAHNLDIPARDWPSLPSRLAEPVDAILELLGRHDTTATFFVLGWVVRRSPGIVRRIVSAGHEIASHGNWHQPLSDMTPESFRADLLSAKAALDEIAGQEVRGYRAPSYSIGADTTWALDILEEEGFDYDSSIYPVRAPHGRYGLPGTPLTPYRVRPALWEFPLPTWRIPGRRIPAATGAYLRLFPTSVTEQAIAQNQRLGVPVVINLHPWEFDPDQPRVRAPLPKRVLHYTNLHGTAAKLDRLLDSHSFIPLRDAVALCEPEAVTKPKAELGISEAQQDLIMPGTIGRPSVVQAEPSAGVAAPSLSK